MSEPALKIVQVEQPLKLDLGCGQSPREGFEGVDRDGDVAKFKQDLLSFPWQWETSSVDELHCSHFAEHIPMEYVEHGGRKKDLFEAFFDECFRVLKPGGKMTVIVPALQSVRAFQDPTHRRYLPAEIFYYLSKDWRTLNKLDHCHGDCNFSLSVNPTVPQAETLRHQTVASNRLRECWNVAVDFHALLTAIKP